MNLKTKKLRTKTFIGSTQNPSTVIGRERRGKSIKKTIGTWLSEATGALETISEDKDQARTEARSLAAFALKKPESWLIAHDDKPLTRLQSTTLNRLLKRRQAQEPLPYILNSATFLGRDFFVDRRVLIPRPETEDLVLEALKHAHSGSLVVEIGTGSGAIAISMVREHPKVRVFASETDAKTLAVAKKNARNLAPGRVKFFHGSLLHPALLHAITHHPSPITSLIFIANLPYLPTSDRRAMPKSVIGYEPSKALFAKDEGMDLNKKLLKQIASAARANQWNTPVILLEFDPPQAKKLSAYAKSLFDHAEISVLTDRCGRKRILRVTPRSLRKSRRASSPRSRSSRA